MGRLIKTGRPNLISHRWIETSEEEDLEVDKTVSLVDVMDNSGLDHGGGAPTSGQTTIPRFVRVWLVRVWP